MILQEPSLLPAIVGVGARCAVGLTAPAAAASVRAGISGFAEHAYMIDKAGQPMIVACEPTLDPKLQAADRFSRLARPAMTQALAPFANSGLGLQEVEVLIGMPERRPGLPGHIDDALRDLLPHLGLSKHRVEFFPRGNAASLIALQHAEYRLQARKSRFCLVGGVDSYLTADTLEWMDAEGILKSSANRNGFPPGEAAAFCLVTARSTAEALGLCELGCVETVASAREESPIRTETICVGLGLSRAIREATAGLCLPEERIDESICDLNGEPYRSEEFALTVLRTQLAFADATRFVTPADCWGDVGAASGPLFASLAVAAGLRGYAKGPRTLVWVSSIGGDRAAAILQIASSTDRQFR